MATLEELESEYRMLLESKIYDLKHQRGLNAMSRLDTSGQRSSNMSAVGQRDTVELQEIMRNKRGLAVSGKSYGEIMEDLVRGKYRDKHVKS